MTRSGAAAAAAAMAIAGVLTGCAGVAAQQSAGGDVVAINGTHLYVHREGRGEPAIVVHGGPVLDHGYLRPHLAAIGNELELIYYDQRLSGRSAGTVDSASVRLDTFVADIEALRAALDLDRVHLIAHSWGGLLAMKYALAHPERLRSLVLISPMPPSAALWREEQAAMAAALTAEDTAGAGALRATPAFAAREPAAVEAVLRHSFRSQFHDPARAEELRFHVEPDYAERSRQFGFMLPDLLAYDLRAGLAAVGVPTLVLYGADEVGARIGGEAIVRAMPNARLVALHDAGHFPFIERPHEFLRLVRQHVAAREPPDHAEVWGAAGLGAGVPTSGGDGIGNMAQLVYQKGPHHAAVRGLVLHDLAHDTDEIAEVGALYGRTRGFSWGDIAVASGVSAVVFDGCPDDDDADSCRTFGVPVVAEAALQGRFFGLGLQAFANLNSKAPYTGATLFLQLGRLR